MLTVIIWSTVSLLTFFEQKKILTKLYIFSMLHLDDAIRLRAAVGLEMVGENQMLSTNLC